MQQPIRIGTRESQLALWQAHRVQDLLNAAGHETALVPIKSEGDIDLVTPLYEIGVTGIFTKTLDVALLSGRIDIAVHSLKDVPTQMPKNIVTGAVLERGPVKDILVYKDDVRWMQQADFVANIATSSTRRKAQWLRRFPQHQLHNLRGNVNTRLQKLAEEHWNGAIFAAAGLERIGLRPANSIELDWMLPAPAQGAVVAVCREDDKASRHACSALNHAPTRLCTHIERDFLRALMGGCTTPISAYAYVTTNNIIHFNGEVCSPDGTQTLTVTRNAPVADAYDLGKTAADELLAQGAREIVNLSRNAR